MRKNNIPTEKFGRLLGTAKKGGVFYIRSCQEVLRMSKIHFAKMKNSYLQDFPNFGGFSLMYKSSNAPFALFLKLLDYTK